VIQLLYRFPSLTASDFRYSTFVSLKRCLTLPRSLTRPSFNVTPLPALPPRQPFLPALKNQNQVRLTSSTRHALLIFWFQIFRCPQPTMQSSEKRYFVDILFLRWIYFFFNCSACGQIFWVNITGYKHLFITYAYTACVCMYMKIMYIFICVYDIVVYSILFYQTMDLIKADLHLVYIYICDFK